MSKHITAKDDTLQASDKRDITGTNYEDENKRGLDVSVLSSFSPSGLNIGGLITEPTVNSLTWTALPTTPLENRNAINIQNNSDQDIKINFSDSIVGFVGIIISAGTERFYRITDSIIIYAKTEIDTAVITIEELA